MAKTYCLKAGSDALLADFRRLFETTPAFCDTDLGTSRCLLAAAMGGSLEAFDERVALMADAAPDAAQALKNFVQGQTLTVKNEGLFFKLFELSRTTKVSALAKSCQQAAQKLDNMDEDPIRMQLSQEDQREMRANLRKWQAQTSGPFLDAEVSVGCGDTAGGEAAPELKTFRVHAVVLAASCDYIRGLWASGFSEAIGNGTKPTVLVDYANEAGSAQALIKLLYGEEVKLTFEELLQLHRFADTWQCHTVLDVAQKAIKPELDLPRSITILGEAGQPDSLLHMAADAAASYFLSTECAKEGGKSVLLLGDLVEALPRTKFEHGGKDYYKEGDKGTVSDFIIRTDGEPAITVTWERTGHASNFPKATWTEAYKFKAHKAKHSMSFAAAVRLLRSLSEQISSTERRRTDAFPYINPERDTVDVFCQSSEWLQVPAETISDLLQVVIASTWNITDSSVFLKHLIRWVKSPDLEGDVGQGILRLTQLYREGCEDMQPWLRKAICLSGATLPFVCEMLEAAFGQAADSDQAVQEREAKRRKTSESSWSGVLPALEPPAKELIGAAALDLAAERFANLSGCRLWLEVSAPVLVKVALLAMKTNEKLEEATEQDFLQPVVLWARATRSEALFEALELMTSSKAAAPAAISKLERAIRRVLQERLAAAESQNAILEGGKHREELDAAVADAVAKTEAKLRSEWAFEKATLRAQMADEGFLQAVAAMEEKCKVTFQELRTSKTKDPEHHVINSQTEAKARA